MTDADIDIDFSQLFLALLIQFKSMSAVLHIVCVVTIGTEK